MSIAMPKTVPTAAPVSIPPFAADAITSSSAITLPTDTVEKSEVEARVLTTVESIKRPFRGTIETAEGVFTE